MRVFLKLWLLSSLPVLSVLFSAAGLSAASGAAGTITAAQEGVKGRVVSVAEATCSSSRIME